MTKKITWHTTSSTTVHTSNYIHNINNEKRENKQASSIRESLLILAGTIVTIGLKKVVKSHLEKVLGILGKVQDSKKKFVWCRQKLKISRFKIQKVSCFDQVLHDQGNGKIVQHWAKFEIMILNCSFSVLCFTMLKVSKPEIQSRASLKVGWF